ncbi:hypothetical protein FGO68_gene17681 [Halteria grandinella]|uniref:Uncharacterized protein n=1 Tax=Halteria grandinella TaxID=5974 RepID=A0A8J8NSS4_HALGN|nr:hypothetical protein FGO68_gene17681 [Halteria grandinella]
MRRNRLPITTHQSRVTASYARAPQSKAPSVYSYSYFNQEALLGRGQAMVSTSSYKFKSQIAAYKKRTGGKANMRKQMLLRTTALAQAFKSYGQRFSSYPRGMYIPLLMFTCGVYGAYSVQATNIPPQISLANLEESKEAEEKFAPLKNFQAFKQWVKAGVRALAEEIVAQNTKEVKKQGLQYLERMFKNKQVHESLIKLLKGAIKDERFVGDSKRFGIDWISKTITAPKTKQALKGLMGQTFTKDTRVQKEAIEVCKYFVNQPESRQLTRQLVSAAILRPEALNAMNAQLAAGGTAAAKADQTRSQLSKSVMESINNKEISGELSRTLVYKPLYNIMSFGLYNYIAGGNVTALTDNSQNQTTQ